MANISKLLLLGSLAYAVAVLASHAVDPAIAPAPAGQAVTSSWHGQSGPGSVSTVTAPQGDSNASANWAGFGVSGGPFTAITGSWVVPTVSGSQPDSADATWIGIGGMNSTDLIQTGTQNTVNSDGSVTINAFYEMLPNSEQMLHGITASPGDSVSAAITQLSPGSWQIRLRDITSGQTGSADVSYDSTLSSAEWVQEDPSSNFGAVALDNFGTVRFTSARATSNGSQANLSQAGAQQLSMINDAGQPLATVSALGSDNASFSVTRTSAASTAISSYTGRLSRHGRLPGYDFPTSDLGGHVNSEPWRYHRF